MKLSPETFWDFFEDLDDPRCDHGLRHSAEAKSAIAIIGILCGADDWIDIADFAEEKRAWLETFLELPHGTPSHDTFGRFFALIDPAQFVACLTRWTESLVRLVSSDLIAIDGKRVRRSHDRISGKSALHLVGAWCRENRRVLGQIATEADSNEITAIPKLLELLDIQDAVVSIDAIGTQREIAGKLLEQQGNSVLALKRNQPDLHRDVTLFFQEAFEHGRFEREVRPLPHTTAIDYDKGHGRMEKRTVWCVSDLDWLASHKWPDLASVICVESERTVEGYVSRECRYSLSSLNNSNPPRLLTLIRSHWSIENSLHWSLDVCFGEDQSRVRTGYAAENFAALKRQAVSLLKNEPSFNGSLKRRQKRCAMRQSDLLKVLSPR